MARRPFLKRKRSAAHAAKIERASYDKECAIAEYVADTDCSLADCALHFGLSYPSITIYWRRIKARLGEQAV